MTSAIMNAKTCKFCQFNFQACSCNEFEVDEN